MKLFVASESRGGEGDFPFTIPGELVHYPPVVCDCTDCGSAVAMAGFASHRATTCFIAEHDAELFVNYGAKIKEHVEVPDDLLQRPEDLGKYLAKSRAYTLTLPPKR